MRRILSRRTFRELSSHGMRYLALALMIALAMYLIVSLIGAADTVIVGADQHAQMNHIEDGQFSTFVPLTAEQSAASDEAQGEENPTKTRPNG